jgi:hypothetical protein
MATVVVDSSNFVEHLQAEAAAEAEAVAAAEGASTETATGDDPGDKRGEPAAAATQEDPDENGLTAEDRKGLTDKMQKTVGKKHRQMKEAEEFAADQYNQRRLAEARAAELERENAELKKGKQPPEPAKAAPADEGKPKREAFQTEEAWRDAVDDWRVDQKFKAREAEEARKRQEAEGARIREVASARIAKAIELVPDYQEVTEGADMEVPGPIAEYMQESELFAELGYHFAKHPEDLTRLSKMPMRTYGDVQRLGVAIAKIESTLTPFAPADGRGNAKADTLKPSTTSNGAKPSTETGSATPPGGGAGPSKPRAAAPITPLSSGGPSVEKDPADMNIRETIVDWQKGKKVDLGRRRRH